MSFGPTGLKVPSMTTAQRPSAPTSGTLIYNTTTAQYELYNGSQWVGVYLKGEV